MAEFMTSVEEHMLPKQECKVCIYIPHVVYHCVSIISEVFSPGMSHNMTVQQDIVHKHNDATFLQVCSPLTPP